MTVNYIIVIAAAVASFAFGAVYYTALGGHWLRALGKTEADMQRMGRSLPVSLAVSFVAALLMAWIFAGLTLHLAKSGVPASLRNGMLSGLFCWAGFVVTTLATNYRYSGASFRLGIIDATHWLGVLLLQGAIIGGYAIRA